MNTRLNKSLIKELKEQHGIRVTIFDEFFERHPEYSKLIKDRRAYAKWRVEEVDY